jgi:hypothetical protein
VAVALLRFFGSGMAELPSETELEASGGGDGDGLLSVTLSVGDGNPLCPRRLTGRQAIKAVVRCSGYGMVTPPDLAMTRGGDGGASLSMHIGASC